MPAPNNQFCSIAATHLQGDEMPHNPVRATEHAIYCRDRKQEVDATTPSQRESKPTFTAFELKGPTFKGRLQTRVSIYTSQTLKMTLTGSEMKPQQCTGHKAPTWRSHARILLPALG
eukprot:3857643-Amphidinium_carterae.1